MPSDVKQPSRANGEDAHVSPTSEAARRPLSRRFWIWKRIPRSWLVELAGVATAMALALLGAYVILDLAGVRKDVPFTYGGDALSTLMFIKGLVVHGWIQENPDLGAPGQLEMYDYPLGGDALNFAIIKAMSWVDSRPAMVMNMFYLSTFPLAASTAYFVLRWLRVSISMSIVAGAMFAVTPYHFARGVGHLMLSAYFMVPVGVFLAVRLYRDADRCEPRIRKRVLASFGLLAACAAVASTGVYYAAFTCVLVVILGSLGALRRRSWKVVGSTAATVGAIVIVVAINQLPSIMYEHEQGPNTVVAVRNPAESEVYALNVTQLILPVGDHRIDELDRARSRYMTSSVAVTPESAIPLGTIASVGFLAMFVIVAMSAAGVRTPGTWMWLDRAQPLAIGSTAFVIIAAAGGFATVFNYVVDPSIRAWARSSVLIAFLAIATLALLIDAAVRAFSGRSQKRAALLSVLAGVLVVGAVWFDQATPAYRLEHSAAVQRWESDKAFGRSADAAFARGDQVFQLPYVSFPESPIHAGQDGSYDNARAYLHSDKLHWSFASMAGRPDDIGAELANLPAEKMIEALRQRGFAALWLDRAGLTTVEEQEIEPAVRVQLGEPEVESSDGRFALYRL